MQINKVAVLGAGLMGNQIAMQIALNGFETVCFSRREETVAKATKESLMRLVLSVGITVFMAALDWASCASGLERSDV
mgnify:CR=1 FL=1